MKDFESLLAGTAQRYEQRASQRRKYDQLRRARRLLLTNHHVLDGEEEASFSLAEFDYQFGSDGRLGPMVTFAFEPGALFLTNPALDYTLVAVQATAADGRELADFGWNTLVEAEGEVIKGEELNIIQHPGGEPKQLALRENELIDVLEDFLHYRTDAAPGASSRTPTTSRSPCGTARRSGCPAATGSRRTCRTPTPPARATIRPGGCAATTASGT